MHGKRAVAAHNQLTHTNNCDFLMTATLTYTLCLAVVYLGRKAYSLKVQHS